MFDFWKQTPINQNQPGLWDSINQHSAGLKKSSTIIGRRQKIHYWSKLSFQVGIFVILWYNKINSGKIRNGKYHNLIRVQNLGIFGKIPIFSFSFISNARILSHINMCPKLNICKKFRLHFTNSPSSSNIYHLMWLMVNLWKKSTDTIVNCTIAPER